MSTPLMDDYRILVIDDNPKIHRDFLKILMPEKRIDNFNFLDQELFGDDNKADDNALLPNFKIDCASQGQEGVEYIKKSLEINQPYAMAFVDIRMPPGWDGVETIKHIWEVDPTIQIVICTAYSDYSWSETMSALGIKDNLLILKKPFDNVAVRQLACALTKKWQLTREAVRHTDYLESCIRERTYSLQHSLSVTRATLESSTDGILVVSNDDTIIDYNDRFIDMWNIPKDIVNNMTSSNIMEWITKHVEDPHAIVESLARAKANEEHASSSIVRCKDLKIFESSYQPHRMNGKIIGRVWSFHDITKRAHLEEKLGYQATHDALTDLPNRILLLDKLQHAIAAADLSQTIVGILFFDLDRFKLINDSLGHDVGDMVLKTITDRLKKALRKQDMVARLGGDEFVVVLTELSNKTDGYTIAGQLLEDIKQPFNTGGREITITASLGICFYPIDCDKVDELLRNADIAMYSAKKLGFNQFQTYTPEMSEQTLYLLEQETDLRRSLQNEDFVLMYQPQYNIKTNELFGFEALIRWNHPTRGLLQPSEFISSAEENGLIVPIGEWVMRTACRQSKLWQDQGFNAILMSVNVANAQLKSPNFVRVVQQILEETGLEPHLLEIEITENVLFYNESIIHTIHDLKKIGVKIALDDFGTGNNVISYLKQIPIDHLKIDKSFIQNIKHDASNQVIIKAMAMIAGSLDFEIIAEGIEHSEHLQFLTKQNFQIGQGYYFNKPLTAEEALSTQTITV